MWAHARGTREHASAPTRRVSRILQSSRDTRDFSFALSLLGWSFKRVVEFFVVVSPRPFFPSGLTVTNSRCPEIFRGQRKFFWEGAHVNPWENEWTEVHFLEQCSPVVERLKCRVPRGITSNGFVIRFANSVVSLFYIVFVCRIMFNVSRSCKILAKVNDSMSILSLKNEFWLTHNISSTI